VGELDASSELAGPARGARSLTATPAIVAPVDRKLTSISAAILLAVGCAASGGSAPSPASNAQTKALASNPYFAAPVGEYGFSETNPVLVASLGGRSPVENEHIYLGRLRGPGGERVHYRRIGSCCEFPTPNGLFGDKGLLDQYEVTYDGLAHPLVLYLDMYDPGEAQAPTGFVLLP
jgi:hypothetical protein